MKRHIDWFLVVVILAAGAGLIFVLAALGRSPMALMIPSASAGEANLTWEAPTTNCDGSPIGAIQKYDLRYGQSTGEVPADLTAWRITGLKPGTWWFSLAAVTADGVSEFTTAEKVVAPAEFVTLEPTVYTVVKRTDRFVLLPVGSAPVGTQCIATETLNGHYVIPRSAVTWSGSVRPDVVVAKCG